jgi:hypothetical protein
LMELGSDGVGDLLGLWRVMVMMVMRRWAGRGGFEEGIDDELAHETGRIASSDEVAHRERRQRNQGDRCPWSWSGCGGPFGGDVRFGLVLVLVWPRRGRGSAVPSPPESVRVGRNSMEDWYPRLTAPGVEDEISEGGAGGRLDRKNIGEGRLKEAEVPWSGHWRKKMNCKLTIY